MKMKKREIKFMSDRNSEGKYSISPIFLILHYLYTCMVMYDMNCEYIARERERVSVCVDILMLAEERSLFEKTKRLTRAFRFHLFCCLPSSSAYHANFFSSLSFLLQFQNILILFFFFILLCITRFSNEHCMLKWIFTLSHIFF